MPSSPESNPGLIGGGRVVSPLPELPRLVPSKLRQLLLKRVLSMGKKSIYTFCGVFVLFSFILKDPINQWKEKKNWKRKTWKGRFSYQGNWWGSQPSSQGFLGAQKPWERGWWESVTIICCQTSWWGSNYNRKKDLKGDDSSFSLSSSVGLLSLEMSLS